MSAPPARPAAPVAAFLITAFLLCAPLLAAPPAAAQAVQEPAEEPVRAPEAQPAAAESGEDDEEPPPPPAERPAFELPLPEDKGGGVVRGRAGTLEFVQEQTAEASGGVEMQYQDIELQAERVVFDLEAQEVTAVGQVILDQGPRRISAQRAVFDLGTKTGTFYEATAYVAPDYYFSGRQVAKVGEDVYTVDDGVFTSCEGDVPDWSFRLGRARVELEGYARIRNASMRVKKVPVFYTPYIVWPAKTERSSGFLIPEIGYSERKGAQLGLAYYQTLGRSYDATFHADLYSEDFVGLGTELRYRPSEGTEGILVGYVVRDPQAEGEAGLDEWRWKVDWDHVTNDLPYGLRGVLSYHDFSDFQFFRDFERDFDRNTIRFLESRGFVAGNWGPHALNVLVNERETFLAPATDTQPERTITQAKLPEIEYRLRSTRLGGLPLYLDMLSSLSYLSIDRQRNYNDSYGRFDLFPQLTLPLSAGPWLSLSLSGGGRFTWYSDSLFSQEELAALPPEEQDAILADSRFRDETLTRAVPFAGAELVGPSFSRIFDARVGSFARFKHVIEPRFTATWLGDFDEQGNVPNFDEVDDLRRTVSGFGLGSTRSGRWSIVNRLLAKPSEEAGGSAREILSLDVFQEISFDDRQPLQRAADGSTTQEGPLSTRLRFSPSLATNFAAQADYSTFFSNLVSTSFSGTWRSPRATLGATWFTRYRPEPGDTLSDQVRFYGAWNALPGRLRLEAAVNYDIERSLWQQQAYVLSYNSQCYSVRLEMRDFRAGDRRDTEYFFTLSLKNVGTFLPLTARSSTTLP